MTRSALVNDTSYIVENIIMADPADPCPFTGMFMVGLKDPIYEEKDITYTTTFPAGTTWVENPDKTITVILPNGDIQNFPEGTIAVTNYDGTVTTTYTTTENVVIDPGTPCGIGWVYDPITKTFSSP